MMRILNSLLAVGICCILLVIVARLSPRWAARGRLDLPELLEKIVQEGKRADQLQAEDEAAFASCEAKDAIVVELAVQRLPLREAVTQFRSLLAKRPGVPVPVMDELKRAYPARSEEEPVCRHLIWCVKEVLLKDEPSRAAIVVPLLEAEMHDYLKSLTIPPKYPTSSARQR